MDRIRIGIVGCGNVLSAYWPQAQRLSLDGQAEVVAACGRPSQREFVTTQLGVRQFVTDYRELLDSPDIDLVAVLTSTPSHFVVSKAALLADKHVLCEKPMAMRLAEGAELVELARRAPVRYLPAPFTVLSPTFRAIARHLRQGDIGKVGSARGRYGWSGPWWNDWFYRAGGGPLFDLACYNLTTLTGWLGPARRVLAMAGTVQAERLVDGKLFRTEVEDNVQVLVDFGEACFAVVTSGYVIQQYRSPALELYGTEGTLQMLGDDWDPDGYELWQNRAGCWKVFKETDVNWPWTDGLRHLVECIRTGTKPLVTPEHAYHVLEIMLAAQAAGRDGQARVVQSRFERIEFPHEEPVGSVHLIHDRTRRICRTYTSLTMKGAAVPQWLVYSLLTLIFWGLWGVLGKATGDMSAGQCQAFSTIGILPVMLAVAVSPGFRGQRGAMRGTINSFLAGVLVGVGNASYYQAVSLAKAATTVSFTMLYPVVTVVLAMLVLREKPHPLQFAGILGSLAAIYLLSVSQSGEVNSGGWLLYSLACVVLWGTAALLMKIATRDASAAQSTFWFLAAFVPLALWILAVQPRFFVDTTIQWSPSLHDWLILTAMGTTFGLGNLTLLAAYRHDGKASVVTPLAGMYPVVTIPLAIVFFSERVGVRESAGIILALVSAVVLMLEPSEVGTTIATTPVNERG